VSRRLGSNHDHIDVFAGHNLAIVNVEAMREGKCRTLLHIGLDLGTIHGRNMLIGHQHHDEVSAFDRISDFSGVQLGLLDLVPRRAAFTHADSDLDTGIIEVLRMRVPLGAIADDGDFLALDEFEIAVFVVKNLH